jgi:hypothetical protein
MYGVVIENYLFLWIGLTVPARMSGVRVQRHLQLVHTYIHVHICKHIIKCMYVCMYVCILCVSNFLVVSVCPFSDWFLRANDDGDDEEQHTKYNR